MKVMYWKGSQERVMVNGCIIEQGERDDVDECSSKVSGLVSPGLCQREQVALSHIAD